MGTLALAAAPTAAQEYGGTGGDTYGGTAGTTGGDTAGNTGTNGATTGGTAGTNGTEEGTLAYTGVDSGDFALGGTIIAASGAALVWGIRRNRLVAS